MNGRQSMLISISLQMSNLSWRSFLPKVTVSIVVDDSGSPVVGDSILCTLCAHASAQTSERGSVPKLRDSLVKTLNQNDYESQAYTCTERFSLLHLVQ